MNARVSQLFGVGQDMLASKNFSCEGRFKYGSESLKEKTVVKKLTTYLVIGPVVIFLLIYTTLLGAVPLSLAKDFHSF